MKSIEVKKVSETVLREVAKKILKVISPVKIIVFGSYAYGHPHEGSDLDILVVVDEGIRSRYELMSELYGVLFEIDIPKDIVVATESDVEEWRNVSQAFLTTIVKKGRVIYERQNGPRKALDKEGRK